MVNPVSSHAEGAWKRALQPGPECLALERIAADDWTPAEAAHVASCARCEAERQLFAAFEADVPGEDDALVAEIAGRVASAETRPGPVESTRVAVLSRTGWWQVAASVLVVAGVGALWLGSRPARPASTSGDVGIYRSASIQTIGPKDDIRSAPTVFEWVAVAGAARYDVEVREVDGSVFWSASSGEPRLPVPPDVVLRFVPAKTLLWSVTARNVRGEALDRSDAQRVRVVPGK